MGSKAIKLPVIDLSNSKQDSSIWESTKSQVYEALQEYGCFEATFNQIPLHLKISVLNNIHDLFDLPLQTKLRNLSDEKPYHGYLGQHATSPLYESLGIEDALSLGSIESFVNLLWPQGNPTFIKNIKSFSEHPSELDKLVRRMVVESLGLENYMADHMDSTNYLIRAMKYDAPVRQDSVLGLPSHKDKNIVTILCQNDICGLEVLTRNGEWIVLEPSLNSFIVIIGESLHAWTNGCLHSPYHRVMMRGDEARYSFGLFSITKDGYVTYQPSGEFKMTSTWLN